VYFHSGSKLTWIALSELAGKGIADVLDILTDSTIEAK
jgi:hypothetical protein